MAKTYYKKFVIKKAPHEFEYQFVTKVELDVMRVGVINGDPLHRVSTSYTGSANWYTDALVPTEKLKEAIIKQSEWANEKIENQGKKEPTEENILSEFGFTTEL